MSEIPYFTLNTGAKMPSVGMGCWMGSPGGASRVHSMCETAIEIGYRHFDTAAGYANEQEVGRAVRDSKVPRSEIFITTKLWSTAHHRVREACEASLARLGLDYIDLYLMHWPQAYMPAPEDDDPTQAVIGGGGRVVRDHESPTIEETWAAMEALLETGKVRAIGISNFGPPLLQRLLKSAKVVPAANQMQAHPSLPWHELKAMCDAAGILLVAYSPLGQPRPGEGLAPVFQDEALVKAAARTGSSPAQVALSWAVQRGTAVVPKTENPERMRTNLLLVKLTEDEMSSISAAHKKPGMHRSLLAPVSDDGTIFGWTYEQLGWNMAADGEVIAE